MNTKRIQIAPSILSADFARLEQEVKAAEDAGADLIHCDVMDGHFVPNITFGPFIVEAVKRCVKIPLDVHLMISNPEKYIGAFCDAGANTLTIHAETVSDLPQVLGEIRKRQVRAGVAVNPDKPVKLFLDHVASIDQIVIMSVFAGFGGQSFIPAVLDKISEVFGHVQKSGQSIDIEVDGGINAETAFECASRGANVFVAGSYIFGSQDYRARISLLRDSIQRAERTH